MYGNTTLSADPSGGIYQPRCIWIDRDDSDGSHTKAMGIHLPSFLPNQGRVDQYNADNDVMCKADPRFKLYDQLDVEDPIPFFKNTPFDLQTLIDFNHTQTLDPANWGTTPVDRDALQGIEKRNSGKNGYAQASSQDSNSTSSCATVTNTTISGSGSAGNKGDQSPDCASNNSGNNTNSGNPTAPKQNAKHRGQLIKSGSQYHSAAELSGSATSYGPDFVSIYEGVFCDMDQKKIWPLCKDAKQAACFDETTNKMRLGAGNSRRDGKGIVLPRKDYTDVEQW
jgi:hypothetical protein